MRSLFVLLALMPTAVSANDCCFVCQSSVPRQVTVIKPVQTITRQVSLEPSRPQEIDPEGIIAEARALEMAWFAIDSRELKKPNWRAQRFTNNVGEYQPSRLIQRQTVQTQTVMRNVAGVVDTSFRILPNGVIDFNVTREQQAAQYNSNYYGSNYSSSTFVAPATPACLT